MVPEKRHDDALANEVTTETRNANGATQSMQGNDNPIGASEMYVLVLDKDAKAAILDALTTGATSLKDDPQDDILSVVDEDDENERNTKKRKNKAMSPDNKKMDKKTSFYRASPPNRQARGGN